MNEEKNPVLPCVPYTEGIKYAGSKLKLLPFILGLARETGCRSVFDAFSGSTRVSQAFAATGYSVTANDCAVYSKVFNTAYLLNKKNPSEYIPLIEHLDSLPPVDGWFTQHYGGCGDTGISCGSDGLKKPWQIKNTMKLDAIRTEIDRLGLDEVTRAVCLSSLMLALDKVDNTIGHFVSYLNNWSARSYGDLKLVVPSLRVNTMENTVLDEDVFSAAENESASSADAAYLDPPYGSNNHKMPPSRIRYRAYYHIWTTICLNDMPSVTGKAGRRADAADKVSPSVFEDFRKTDCGDYVAADALNSLIKKLSNPFIILSYGSSGRINLSSLQDILSSNGKILKAEKINFKKNVRASMKSTNIWAKSAEEKNVEYLFLLRK